MQPRIPDVVILDEIGRGRGGLVYRGSFQGRACAIKLPNAESLPFDRAHQVFEQDVLHLARLPHTGLPRVLQLDATHETPYAILAPQPGRPLDEALDTLREAEAVGLALQLAACLSELHSAGFVHGQLGRPHVLWSAAAGSIRIRNLGSVHRSVPFDAASDFQALAALLRALGMHAVSDGASSELTRIAERLSTGARFPLQQVMHELAARHATLVHNQQAARAFGPWSRPTKPVRSELSRLRMRWEAAGDRENKVLLVLGAAGSGKTRLLRGFAEFLQNQSALVLATKCAEGAAAPFSAIKGLLDSHLTEVAQLEPKQRARMEASLRASAGPLASYLQLLSPRLSSVLGSAQTVFREGDAQQIFVDGVAEFLAKHLENAGKSALFIDDVHWLDANSRMVLSRLATRLCPQGHLLLCSARDDEEARENVVRLRAVLPFAQLEEIQLGPLSERDARDVVAEFLGVTQVSQAAIVEPLSRLSDGTPLSLLELLELAIEQRLLRPRRREWHLSTAALQQLRLPASSRALIERRLCRLDPAAVTALRAAAVLRTRIEPAVLAGVIREHPEQARIALDRAAGARLLVRCADGSYEFVHDSVWEALLRPVARAEQRELHQRAADALMNESRRSAEHDYELARHLAAGVIEQDPRRTYHALRKAGRRASAACDHVLALSFLKPAEHAAELAGISLGRDTYLDLAEASLRIGENQDSLKYFALALHRSQPGFEAAHVRGRIAWVHHLETHVEESWIALDAALREYDRGVPSGKSTSMLRAGLDRVVLPTRLGTALLSQADVETLCALYILCTRVAIDSGRPQSAFASILHITAAAKHLMPCRVLVHAELLTAFALSLMSRHAPWRRHLQRAEELARFLSDPVARALCYQIHHVIAGWLGDFDESERLGLVCIEEYGHLLDLADLCQLCLGMYGAQILLGRPRHALTWLERAIDRVQHHERAPTSFTLVVEAARATLIVLGREHEIAELDRRLARVQRPEIRRGSYLDFVMYQVSAQRLVARDDLGPAFERLHDEWQSHQQTPKGAHLLAALYYVHVAHARVHQCLHARPSERRALLDRLGCAVTDLQAAGARMPAIAAHAEVTRAALCWFRAREADAEQALAKAEHLARETNCPWVMFAASRLRAHMQRARGRLAAARDEALRAAQIAKQDGPPRHLRLISEEFELVEHLGSDTANEADLPSARRHLDALLHIARTSGRDLGPSRQARFILQELLGTLAAERGFLFMRGAGSDTLQRLASCRADGAELSEDNAAYDETAVETVYATGQTLVVPCTKLRDETLDDTLEMPERACLVVALLLREHIVGVLYLDRPSAAGGFSGEDRALLEALANQVPVALELAHSLRERDRLEHHLRQAQKMEAIGRFAGGIAHDFNNMLATIEFAASRLVDQVHPEGAEDLAEIREAAHRGADLTRQLLMFSRGESMPAQRIDLGRVLQRLAATLRRMVRADVHIDLLLPESPLHTMADRSQIERLVINLCRNASDAMPQGGRLAIRLVPAAETPRPLASTGVRSERGYAELCVSDTGTGMSEQVRARLFEPFFTTKSSQEGTGLGLAIVYTIVKQYGGHIEVASDLGAGTTFRIHLPLAPYAAHDPYDDERIERPLRHTTLRASVRARERARGTVLVVDDDDVLRSQSVRALQEAGFQTLAACDGQDALRVLANAEDQPELAITDLQMPGMDGAQLAARMLAEQPELKLLFVSGEGPDVLVSGGSLNDNAVFLQKPFAAETLLKEVELLLGTPAANRDSGVFTRGEAELLDPERDDEAERPH